MTRGTTGTTDGALARVGLDHVEFHVTDAAAWAADLVATHGFRLVARQDAPGHRRIAVRQGRILLLLTEGVADEHPASGYVHSHGDGVADIALSTTDARAAFAEAVERGAVPIRGPREVDGAVFATIGAFGDLVHTFVQRPPGAGADWCPPGLVPVGDGTERGGDSGDSGDSGEIGLGGLDHFAVCVPAGHLRPTVEFYESVLGFAKTFEERIVIGGQAMDSEVVRSPSGEVVLTILEPDPDREPGQIDDFVKDHGGPGVQHIAFTTEDIVGSVSAMRGRGVEFLSTPPSYYDLLPGRLEPAAHTVPEMRELGILVDEDHDGQLFQIFARSTHPRRTFFFEVIERMGARTFGSGNIRALYEAIELERTGPRPG